MVASYTQLLQRRYQGKLDARRPVHRLRGRRRAADAGAHQRPARLLARRAQRAPPAAGRRSARRSRRALDNLAARSTRAARTIEVGPLPTVTGERALLAPVFQNLVGNAMKFRGDAPPRVRRRRAERDGDEWLFAVSDNGIGIEPQYAERIFVIFQRLHASDEYEGTGIGLAICRKIVEHHGGRIWVEPTPSGGTTFRFTLPARRRSADDDPSRRAGRSTCCWSRTTPATSLMTARRSSTTRCATRSRRRATASRRCGSCAARARTPTRRAPT